ncbi:16S rRNA (uracil(1498)-N(3))-methyltransferase [Chitinophaga pendula]|uniref:RsmE family RNA methyltransferase n=1 Tax=Chitinophaga TaxID=79328 RepID=UPI000BB05CC9|nr:MULTISPECIES: RsmE family RNA methyltransferase [Chitinophaga]ASZ09740.1 hypothetical protein CK934_01490 [Chitinophaga sp. MD30]UCJ07317.1 16S rRNA (uracil(1498)-N(3))-methyltransferase [Chitinophaga pendula]
MATFYTKDITPDSKTFTLDEAASKHCIQVLRHATGDEIMLADGRGGRYTAVITDDNRKKTVVQVSRYEQAAAVSHPLRIAIAFTKNASRIEWFLEKAAEIGVQSIIPLLTQRGEKERFKAERLENILVSAMLQSQQYYLPELTAPIAFDQLVGSAEDEQRLIAHCLPEQKQPLQQQLQRGKGALILIGPEGDFTPAEIALALDKGFTPVSLGDTRLRTETAGMVACVLFNHQ